MLYVLLSFVGLAVLIVVAVTLSLRRQRRIAPKDRERIAAMWRHVLSLQTVESQILEADKVLDEMMRMLGASGSFADKLRSLVPRLKTSQPLWNAHKLRNRLAHEPGARINVKEAAQALQAYRDAKDGFLGN